MESVIVFHRSDYYCLLELLRNHKCSIPSVLIYNETEKLSKVIEPTPPGCLWLMDAIEVDNDSLRQLMWVRTMSKGNHILLAPDACTARDHVFEQKTARTAFIPNGTMFWFTGSRNENPSFRTAAKYLV